MKRYLDNFQQGYVDLVQEVADLGRPASPRGLATREILGAQLVFEDTSNMLPVGVGRGLSVPLNVAHAASLLSGHDADALMLRIAPRLADFSRDGVDRERYGERLRGQWEGSIRHIRADPHTREAIMTLQPKRTPMADGGRNFPCTTSIQVLSRDGYLHMVVGMRSNDVWHGVSGDAFIFATLQRTMAWVLGLKPGVYIHNAASLHLYEKDAALVDNLHAPDRPGWGEPGILGDGFSNDLEDRLVDIQWTADWILGFSRLSSLASESAVRYRASLEKYL